MLTKEDIKQIAEVVNNGFDLKFNQFKIDFKEEFKEELIDYLQNQFKPELKSELKSEVKNEFIPMIRKMIDESNAEQMELIFKHFATKDEVRMIVRDEISGHEKRIHNLEDLIAIHTYKFQVDPMPEIVNDILRIKKKLGFI